MDWTGEGVILSMQLHGETSAIIDILTPDRGRHAGVVRGGASRRMAAILQPGTQVTVEWRARLEAHLGSYRVEPLQSRASILGDRTRLATLMAMCSIARFAFPERMSLPLLYHQSIDLLDRLEAGTDFLDAYVFWELAVLDELGYGLDFSKCVATGVTQELVYISPKSGRAVSAAAGKEWADRMLPLPDFLKNRFSETDLVKILDGLKTTGHFLNTKLAPALGNMPLPQARNRLINMLEKQMRAR